MDVWILGIHVYRHHHPNANVPAIIWGICPTGADVPLALKVRFVPILSVVVAFQRVDLALDGNASLCQFSEFGCAVVASGESDGEKNHGDNARMS